MCIVFYPLVRLTFFVALLSVSLFSVPSISLALTGSNPTHVALVIGNSGYGKTVPLDNPRNDSADLAETLDGMGYDVRLVQDATFEEMRAELQSFSAKARRASVSLIFFAGHGIEVEKKNYLIPIDADLQSGHDVDFQAISLDMVQLAAGARSLNVIILDACRDDPFLRKIRSASGRSRSTFKAGLASIEPDTNTVIGFAAKEGTTASDGAGRNSPYTSALLNHIATPGLDVGQMFRIIRDEVLKETGREQEPFLYGSLSAGTVTLHPNDTAVAPLPVSTSSDTKPSVPAMGRSAEDAKIAWEAVRDSDVVSDFDVIISAYAGTIYEQLAMGRKKQLLAALSPAVAAPAVQAPAKQSWYLATYADLDLFGGDLHSKGLRARSVAECAQSCGNETACRAFTYNEEARRCFLKSSYSFAQVYDGAVAGYYFKAGSAGEAPSVRASWELFSRQDLTGTDLGSTGDMSLNGCMASCANHGRCTGFTFASFLKRNRCWLKSGYAHQPYISANSRKGLVSARRIDRVIAPGSVHAVTAVD
ncbi:MAG: caspase family protein [Rhodobacteraceae bacterium]|nr:caspase family protein [Paracoccaceae bacterium]